MTFLYSLFVCQIIGGFVVMTRKQYQPVHFGEIQTFFFCIFVLHPFHNAHSYRRFDLHNCYCNRSTRMDNDGKIRLCRSGRLSTAMWHFSHTPIGIERKRVQSQDVRSFFALFRRRQSRLEAHPIVGTMLWHRWTRRLAQIFVWHSGRVL